MGSIPLPALGVKPPDSQGTGLDMLRNAYGLQAMQQEAQARKQEQQINALKIQQAQRDQQDQQTIMQAVGQTGGDLEKAIPLLAGKVPQAKLDALKKSDLDHKKELSEYDEKTFSLTQKKHSALADLYQQAQSLPDDQYAQAWPQIAASANVLEPKLQLNPAQPIPKPALSQLGIGLSISENYIKAEAEKRAIQKAPFEQKKLEADTAKAQAEAGRVGKVPGVDVPYSPEVFAQKKALKPNLGTIGTTDVKDIADAIQNGDQPPTLQGLYKNGAPVRAELARRGVPIAKMEMDWNATKKYLSTLNGSQQVRLRQAITTASDSLDKIEALYNDVQRLAPTGGFKVINRGVLSTMKNLPGEAGAKATALDAQIADLTSELGNVYMGGNSPTDHALSLAQKNLSSDWNDQTFKEALKQARLNLGIRQNSIMHAMPAGLSGETNYAPQSTAAPSGKIRARDSQGKLHEAPAGTALPQGWTLEK